jgi:two-component system, cell cycle response regulator
MHLRRHIPLGWAISLATLVVGTVIMAGLILAGVFGSARALNIGMPVYYVLCLAAGVITLSAGVHNRQRGWGLIGAAAITWTLGGVYYGLAGQPTGMSAANVLWLIFYGPAVAGLITLSRRYAAKADARLWLDGLIGAVGVASAGLLFALPRIVHGHLHGAVLGLDIFEPVADLALIGVVIATLIASRAHAAKSWLVLGAGTALFTGTDCLYLVQLAQSTFSISGPLVAGWLIALTLFALAAWMPSGGVPARRSDAQSQLGWLLVMAAIPVSALAIRNMAVSELPGVALAVLALFGVLARLHLTHRAARKALAAVTTQSLTDQLTGLSNRVRLLADLEEAVSAGETCLLVLFDLDGFKSYNDSFGHPAGDQLLRSLSERLAAVCGHEGARAYRMGGDEFCVLADAGPSVAPRVARLRAALHERGEGFQISASSGHALIGEEVATTADALRLADQRMFAEKHSGSPPAGVQVKDALVRALSERMHELGSHMDGVASMCAAVSLELGLPPKEAERVALAAELHDIGKVAIPDAILRKPGPLTEAEWELMRQHTIIGERIILSAPGLRALGPMIRSAHERWDGGGYPDRLSGDEIPLGAQVIFVCDAYDAMTSERDYCAAVSAGEAVAELRRCAGTQFSPTIVDAFCRVHAALEAADQVPPHAGATRADVLAA